jgi:UDP-glucose 4-epimerase
LSEATVVNGAVLVTGGAGFIGSHVAEAYVAAEYEVTVLDDLSSGRRENVPDGARFVEADVRSAEARELLANGEFTILNHHAAQVDVAYSVADPVADVGVNVVGLLNVLEGARAGHVTRIVLASSGAIYGQDAALPIDESAPKLPVSPYGVAKLASEYYVTMYGLLYGIDTVVLRYSNVYGPRQDARGEAGVVAAFSHALVTGQPLTVYGDGAQTRDMIYVADVAAANIAASRCAVVPLTHVDARAYNIATGAETTINHLATALSDVAGRAATLRHAPERQGDIRRSALAAQKARRDLGWQARVSLIDGLPATFRWVREERGRVGRRTAPGATAARRR